jgi:hypothetical protein
MKLIDAVEAVRKKLLVVDVEYSHNSYYVTLSKKQLKNFLRQISIMETNAYGVLGLKMLLDKEMVKEEKPRTSKYETNTSKFEINVVMWSLETKSVEIVYSPDLKLLYIYPKKY